MPVMNMGQEPQTMPQDTSMDNVIPEEDSPYNFGDDGVDEDTYKQEVISNLENHLNSLPDSAKEYLAEYATNKEVATVIGLINGKEVGEYFMQFADPNKTIEVRQIAQQPTQPMGQPPVQPAQAQPQQAQAPQQPRGQGLIQM